MQTRPALVCAASEVAAACCRPGQQAAQLHAPHVSVEPARLTRYVPPLSAFWNLPFYLSYRILYIYIVLYYKRQLYIFIVQPPSLMGRGLCPSRSLSSPLQRGRPLLPATAICSWFGRCGAASRPCASAYRREALYLI